MPRKRRTPTYSDALSYAVLRRKKLKGPSKAMYDVFIDCLLEVGGKRFNPSAAGRDALGLCDECSEKVGQRTG